MRKKIVAGNWKMNKDLQEGVALAKEINDMLVADKPNCEVVICTPVSYTHLDVYKRQDVLRAYRSCFQIEFCFRDVNRYNKLARCQARHKNQLELSRGASFA